MAGARAGVDVDEIRDRAAQAMLASEPHMIVPLPYVLPAAPAAPVALVIEIPSGLPHVYGLDGRYYLRDGTHNSILPAKSLRNLLLTRSEGTWEAMQPAGSSLTTWIGRRQSRRMQRAWAARTCRRSRNC